jgi:purine-nucleoside phosphorylase
MGEERKRVLEAVQVLREREEQMPEVGIILGSGLSHLGNSIEGAQSVEYDDIPHFPLSTVESHHGRLLFGNLGSRRVVAMQGRFHSYEGYDGREMTFGVRVMKELGIKALIVSNACGGLNPQYRAGDLMQIEDHINLLGMNPLIGPNEEEWGPRFPDMSEPYCRKLSQLAHRCALDLGIRLQKGVYVAVAGPNLETRAEYRMLKQMGSDVVGMSTIPEVIVARHMGIPVLAISVVTDMCLPDNLKEATFSEIIAVANEAEPRMTKIITEFLKRVDLSTS